MSGKRIVPLVIALILCMPAVGLGADSGDGNRSGAWQVEREFALFSADWIEKINRNYVSRLGNVEVIRGDSEYIGRYWEVEKNSVLLSVKQVSTSPLAYIGLLEYMEWTYESAALTHDEAKVGPFFPIKGRKVTEIFRYSQDRWLE